MKDLFRSCFLGLFIMACIGCVFVIVLWILVEHGRHTPPEDNYYKKKLEFMANDTMPSCKIIKQKYLEEQYAMAIIKLSESDYQKVLNMVQSDSVFFIITESPFSSVFPLGYELDELMQKGNITENNIAAKYRRYYRYALGFIPPNRIVYNEDLRD